MLDLESPKWAALDHAYGDGSEIASLIIQLKSADNETWETVCDELLSAILHQGDIFSATYAAMPHLVEIATDLGPSEHSDNLLFSIAYAARGGPGPEVPDFLEEDWEETQDEARDLILDRFISGAVSDRYAGALLAGLLYLYGEWSWGETVFEWTQGGQVSCDCPRCGRLKVCQTDGGAKFIGTNDASLRVRIVDSMNPGIVPDSSLEIESEIIDGQLIGLAEASNQVELVKLVRQLFGKWTCTECDSLATLSTP